MVFLTDRPCSRRKTFRLKIGFVSPKYVFFEMLNFFTGRLCSRRKTFRSKIDFVSPKRIFLLEMLDSFLTDHAVVAKLFAQKLIWYNY